MDCKEVRQRTRQQKSQMTRHSRQQWAGGSHTEGYLNGQWRANCSQSSRGNFEEYCGSLFLSRCYERKLRDNPRTGVLLGTSVDSCVWHGCLCKNMDSWRGDAVLFRDDVGGVALACTVIMGLVPEAVGSTLASPRNRPATSQLAQSASTTDVRACTPMRQLPICQGTRVRVRSQQRACPTLGSFENTGYCRFAVDRLCLLPFKQKQRRRAHLVR